MHMLVRTLGTAHQATKKPPKRAASVQALRRQIKREVRA